MNAPTARQTIVVVIAMCATLHSASAEDWPRWRGPRGDGTWNAPKLPAKWPEGGLRQLWKQPVGGGDAGVTVADGRVYTMDLQKEPAEVERALCFDAASGKPLWTHTYAVAYGGLQHANGPRAAPTVSDGRVYTLGALGHLFCLDAATGKLIWSKDMVREHGARRPMWGFAASPLVFENLVIVHTGAEPDGCYIAFDRKTGKQIWRSVADRCGYCTPIIINHNSQPQLIGWTPENIRGLDPRDGKPLWAVPYKVTYGVSIASPVFQEGIVLVCGYWEGSKAVRLGKTATDAALLWEENQYLRGEMSQPLYRDGHVYLLDKSNGLTCFKLATGEKVWDDGHRTTPKGHDPQASLVWLNNGDRAIILNAEGYLILARLNPAGYDEQSRTKIIGKTWAHPAFAGRCVFARDGRELVCVSLLEAAAN
ncbi:MAG: PQQ-like beta-propeller repeat protein [Chloroflexi bacterium]|nr:PQQ-like beta-propeller repeat protein [Chloroflexota bacterium]